MSVWSVAKIELAVKRYVMEFLAGFLNRKLKVCIPGEL